MIIFCQHSWLYCVIGAHVSFETGICWKSSFTLLTFESLASFVYFVDVYLQRATCCKCSVAYAAFERLAFLVHSADVLVEVMFPWKFHLTVTAFERLDFIVNTTDVNVAVGAEAKFGLAMWTTKIFDFFMNVENVSLELFTVSELPSTLRTLERLKFFVHGMNMSCRNEHLSWQAVEVSRSDGLPMQIHSYSLVSSKRVKYCVSHWSHLNGLSFSCTLPTCSFSSAPVWHFSEHCEQLNFLLPSSSNSIFTWTCVWEKFDCKF